MSIEQDVKEISKAQKEICMTLKSMEKLLTINISPEQLKAMKKINDSRLRFQDTQASLRGEMTSTRA